MARGSRFVIGLSFLALIFWGVFGPTYLVVNAPEHADAIVVLEGENEFRPQRGLELLRQGYAPALVLNAMQHSRIFGHSRAELAADFIKTLPAADTPRTHVCTVDALSTQQESKAITECLRRLNAKSVLLVTSDYHTRRALLVFRHELPEFKFSVAAARDPEVYGERWWQHREWAKQFLLESLRLAWFEAVDRWR